MKKISLLIILLLIVSAKVNSQTMNVSYKNLTEKDPVLNYVINATYPKVDFGPEALMGVRGIAQDINTAIDTMVNNKIQIFKKSVSEMPNKTAMNGLGSSLEITSDVLVISGTILSAEIKEFSAVIGMAHPATTINSFNYCTNSVGLLNLADLFKKDSDYLKYISEFCIADLKAKALKDGYTNIDEMITEGASSEEKNFEVWSLTDDSLKIIFNPAQAMPMVFGIRTVSIPLENMTDKINPDGPLNYMFR